MHGRFPAKRQKVPIRELGRHGLGMNEGTDLKEDILEIIGRDGHGMVANIVAGWRPPFLP